MGAAAAAALLVGSREREEKAIDLPRRERGLVFARESSLVGLKEKGRGGGVSIHQNRISGGPHN